MKIDKITLSLRNFGKMESVEVEFRRADGKVRSYYPKWDSIARLMGVAGRGVNAVWSGGPYHLRIAVFPKQKESTDIPF